MRQKTKFSSVMMFRKNETLLFSIPAMSAIASLR
jgi:hypothetical protein